MKRKVALILTVLLSIQSLGSIGFASDASTVYLSESFSSVATNAVPDTMTVKGSDNNRVVTEADGNKALLLDLSMGIGTVSVPVNPKGNKLWLSARIKASTQLAQANLFVLKDNGGKKTKSISYGSDITTVSYDKRFTGVNFSRWQEISVCVDYSAGSYSIYLDGKEVLSDWKYMTKPSKSISFEFDFIPLNDKREESKVWIDDVRVYDGDEYISSFPAGAYNEEVLKFEEATSSDTIKFYKQADLSDGVFASAGIRRYNSSGNPNLIQFVDQQDGNYYFLVERIGGGGGGYHELAIDNCDAVFVVMEFDFCVFQNEGAPNTFLDIRAEDQSWSQDFTIDGSSLVLNRGGSIATTFGEWSNIAIAYNFIDHTFDLYHNRKLVYENVAMANSTFEGLIYARTTLGGTDIPFRMGMDNIYVYEAEAPIDNPAEAAAKTLVSQFAGDEKQVHSFLGDSVAFSVTSGDVYNGETKVEGVGAGIIENGRTLVPVRTFSEAFGIDVDWNGDTRQVTVGDKAVLTVGDPNILKGEETIVSDVAPNIYNDRVYLPLRVLAEQILGKAVQWDEARKMVLMDDGEVSVNTNDATNMDMAYRYLMYDRIPGEELADKLANAPRPRLLAGADRIEELSELVQNNARAKSWFENVKTKCDGYLASEPIAFKLDANGDVVSGRGREEMLIALSAMYRLTDDEKYAERAWKELEVVCAYPHWSQQYIVASAIMIGASVAYDWLYDYLTPEQRKIISDAIFDKGLIRAKRDFSGQFGAREYIRGQDNMTSVCNSAIIMACLAIGDVEEYKDICADVFQSSQFALEYLFKGFEPDGGWREGPGYYNYVVTYLQKCLASLDNALGTTLGYTETPGFHHAGWYGYDMSGPKGYNNMGDGGIGPSREGGEALWFSQYFKEPELTAARLSLQDAYGHTGSITELLCVDPSYIDTSASEVPLDAKYSEIEFAAMRGKTWSQDPQNAMWASFHAGINGFGHGHADAGAFVFDALGERWASDILYSSSWYNLHKWGLSEAKYYEVRGEGHNVFVINPDEGYDQLPSTDIAPITEFASLGEKGSYAITDLTCVYSHQANSAKRGYHTMGGRESFTVRDEISLKKNNSEVYWFMHTTALDIQVFDNYAILTQNGKQLRVDFTTNADNAELMVMEAKSLPTSPAGFTTGADYTNTYKKLALKVTASGDLSITAKLTPLDGQPHDFTIDNLPLSSWANTYGK